MSITTGPRPSARAGRSAAGPNASASAASGSETVFRRIVSPESARLGELHTDTLAGDVVLHVRRGRVELLDGVERVEQRGVEPVVSRRGVHPHLLDLPLAVDLDAGDRLQLLEVGLVDGGRHHPGVL